MWNIIMKYLFNIWFCELINKDDQSRDEPKPTHYADNPRRYSPTGNIHRKKTEINKQYNAAYQHIHSADDD